MAALLVMLMIFLNCIYMVQFYRLMEMLERSANAYWVEIGRPDSFSGKNVSAMLNHLYTGKMREAADSGGFRGTLNAVRGLLPTATLVASAALILVASALNAPAA